MFSLESNHTAVPCLPGRSAELTARVSPGLPYVNEVGGLTDHGLSLLFGLGLLTHSPHPKSRI